MVRREEGEAKTSPFPILKTAPEERVTQGMRVLAMPKRSQLHNPSEAMKAKLDNFFKYLQAGNFIPVALRTSGIEQHQYYYWCNRAKDDRTWWENETALLLSRGIEDELPKSVYQLFLEQVETAIAKAEAKDVDNIRKAADAGSITAAMWRLERKSPERWGNKQPAVQVTSNVQVNNNAAAQTDGQTAISNVTVRQLLAQDPELCDLLSMLAEKAEKANVVAGELVGSGVPGDSAKVVGPVPEDRALASGPLGVRRRADEE